MLWMRIIPNVKKNSQDFIQLAVTSTVWKLKPTENPSQPLEPGLF